jgi:hypothetical protein
MLICNQISLDGDFTFYLNTATIMRVIKPCLCNSDFRYRLHCLLLTHSTHVYMEENNDEKYDLNKALF